LPLKDGPKPKGSNSILLVIGGGVMTEILAWLTTIIILGVGFLILLWSILEIYDFLNWIFPAEKYGKTSRSQES